MCRTLLIIALFFSCAASAEVTLSFVKSNHTNGSTYGRGSDFDGGAGYVEDKLNENHVLLSYRHERSGLYVGYLNKNSYGNPAYIVAKAVKSPVSLV